MGKIGLKMYEVLFDISQLSKAGLLFNLIFFPFEFLVLGMVTAIGWKVKSRNKVFSFAIMIFLVVMVYMNISYYIRKHNYIKKLETSEYSIVEGKIDTLKERGKSTYFSIDGSVFKLSGAGLITPFFNNQYLINELYILKAEVRITYADGNILKLEKSKK